MSGSTFKGFVREDMAEQNQVNSSVQQGIRQRILELYPRLEPAMEDVWPKHASTLIARRRDHIRVVFIGRSPIFWQYKGGPWLPTLRLLRRVPSMMPKVQVDEGTIKFGSSVMCLGLSVGACMDDVEEGEFVQVFAQGALHACAVGVMTKSHVASVDAGVCIDQIHFLSDGLSKIRELSPS